MDDESDLLHDHSTRDDDLDRRTVRKLDFILLPFLALLFLLNSLDKSNIGNAETAGFTRDAGLSSEDVNISLAFFFAFFVALQPVGAAFGRKFGMARWVPACMSLWGLCTILHIWVKRRWQLIVLRIAIATLEAGFYPTTVSYLSLFYTRYEFAVRLGVFYGQTAVAGVVGSVLSAVVFHSFHGKAKVMDGGNNVGAGGWKSWEVLFLIEGCVTMGIALLGFIWLPHSANTAWFFDEQEKGWAEARIRQDRHQVMDDKQDYEAAIGSTLFTTSSHEHEPEAHHRLLDEDEHHSPIQRAVSRKSVVSVTADAGLSRQDIWSAVLNYKIWHLLVCNILSAIPATAFSVFLPLVIKQLSPSLNLSPATSNLLSAPPFAFGAIILLLFTLWSDRSHQRLVPIFWGLGLLLIGLTITVMAPQDNYVLKYIGLCILLSGSFIASPLTVAWLTNNTPEPGKRAILLGLNGWGNLAGVFSALLFTPADRANGYLRPFVITLVCVLLSFAGYIAFWALLVRENKWRADVTDKWSDADREREELFGDVPAPATLGSIVLKVTGIARLASWMGMQDVRQGDEKLTFQYGL